MAKTKTISDELIKKFGNVVHSGRALLERDVKTINISPAIDIGLNGGITEGSFTTLAGPPKTGKTLLALYIAAKCQLPENGSRNVYYSNIEGRLKKRDLDGQPGLNLDKFHILGPIPTDNDEEIPKQLSAEQHLEALEYVIHNDPGCVVIPDSYTYLVTQSELDGTMADQQRATGAKLLYKFVRRIANVVPINRTIVLGIAHMQANPTGYGAASIESAGNAIKYQVDFKLINKGKKEWKIGDQVIGQSTEWLVGCSGLGAPGMTVESWIRFGEGIDEYKELGELAVTCGLIEKGGSWLTVQLGEEQRKVQGMDNLRDLLKENKDVFTELKNKVYTTFGLKKG